MDQHHNNDETALTSQPLKIDSEIKGVTVAKKKKDGKGHDPRKRVSSRFNTFNYTESENLAFIKRFQDIDSQSVRRVSVVRWMINFLVGVYVAVIAIAVTLATRYLTAAKLDAVYTLIKDCRRPICLLLPTFVWMIINMALVSVGAYFVTFHAPLASGSGIPNIKCYLNGIRMPGLLSLRTLLAKAGGVVLSVSGGLACGKEGPMIHSGAICASGLSKVECKRGKRVFRPKVFDPLRTDEERRDFVAAGAASGVSAAFASPVGGVLFSLEEGASFIHQTLTWRMLFSSMTACLVLNVLLSAINGHPEDMSHPGLVSFGHIGDISFRSFEIPIFILMGIFGGLVGAVFVHLNSKITLCRRRRVKNHWLKVAEAVFLAGCSAVIFVCLIYIVPDCQPIRGYTDSKHQSLLSNGSNVSIEQTPSPLLDDVSGWSNAVIDVNASESEDEHDDPYGYHDNHGYVFQGFCPFGEHNRMADILFKTAEGGLHSVLHAPLDEWHIVPLFVLFVVYGLLATWTYGLSVSSGVFTPSLLIGAIWGRIVGIIVMTYIPTAGTNIAKYALIGAAANLGGATRMTISLTVIIIECTGDVTFGLPIMIALIVAKWTGDFFNPGIYDLHIEIQGIPLLPWEPPEMSYNIKASDVMACPVDCLQETENINVLKSIFNSTSSHNGYPVVYGGGGRVPSSATQQTNEQRRRHQDHLQQTYDDVNNNDDDENNELLRIDDQRLKGFLRMKDIECIVREWDSGESKTEDVALEPYMDCSPISIHQDTSLPRIFNIFRRLGLRHLIVVNDYNLVVGIITRLNLAKYRQETHLGHFVLEELTIDKD